MLGGIFDPRGETLNYHHWRPHWSQAGAIVFLTFRTQDSLPRGVIERWNREKRDWLERRGYGVAATDGAGLSALTPAHRAEFRRHFHRCREQALDECRGACLLRRPELSQIVARTLLHFDGERYRLGDFVVMPNHVHVLVAFSSAESLKAQCDSWLHFSAFQIHRAAGGQGKFWHQEPFDHLVRSPEQYDYLRQYIADNPSRARLEPGTYLYRRYSG